MQIAKLEIENFRGIRQGVVRFSPHTVLVGSNNCGKTTVVEALALLFGRDRMVRQLTEHDFYGSNPQPADRILSGLLLTACWLRALGPDGPGFPDQQQFLNALRSEGWSFGAMPLLGNRACPVGCAASQMRKVA